MNVLMMAISSYDFDPRIIRLSSALIEKNICVDLICLRYGRQSEHETLNGVHVHRIMKNFHHDSILSYAFYSLIFIIKAMIKSLVISSKRKPDLVHVNNMPDHLVFTTIIQKLRGVPIILDFHDLTVELFKEKWSEKKFKQYKSILKFVEKLSCNFANQLMTVTKECVDILVSRGNKPEKVTLIMNSTDEKVFRYDDSRFKMNGTNRFNILYHGTIAKRFGLHYFINAMPEIVKVIPYAEFHLFGNISNNEYTDELRKLIDNAGLTNKVFLSDPVPYAEVNNMIKNYDLGVVTYERTEYMNLALPTKACEYAFTGLPFIISDLISVRSVFSDKSVCYVDPENTAYISEIVLDLYNTPKKRKELSKNALADINKISWGVMKKRYIDLIYHLTKSDKYFFSL